MLPALAPGGRLVAVADDEGQARAIAHARGLVRLHLWTLAHGVARSAVRPPARAPACP